MNAVIMSFDPNKKQSGICERRCPTLLHCHKAMKCMTPVESDSVKSARKAKGNHIYTL